MEIKSKENPAGLNLDNWEYFCSFARFYPDLFLDLIKPEKGGLNLCFDQRVFLRCAVRFVSFYGVFSRGYAKTFNEVLAAILCCIFYPNITISLTAQTRENAAGLIEAKYEEIMRFYPMLRNEVVKANFSKDTAEIEFKSGGILSNLANSQSSKGKRRSRLNIEESAQVDNELFQDALQPIVEVPRVCVGKYSLVDPEELHQQINFFTTSWYKGTSEYERSVQMVKDMVNLNGKMVLGASFWLACWFGRGSTKSQILQKKKDMSPTAFALNYESKWVGAVDGALVSIEKLSECRVLSTPILQREKDEDEFYIGVDVARSADTANNQSSISVIKVKRNKVGKVMHLDVVNVLNVSNTKNFINQAITIKRLQKLYGAEMVIVDANGLGIGLCDILHTELEDPLTGEIYTAWKSINTEEDIDAEEYEECLFELKAQQAGVQNKVVVDFIDAVDNGKLRMLESRRDDSFTDKEKEKYQSCVLPFVQTDFMFEEIANLKMKTLGNGGVTVEKTVSKMNKDRFSSLSYVIYYIMEYCNNIEVNQQSTLELLMDYTFL